MLNIGTKIVLFWRYTIIQGVELRVNALNFYQTDKKVFVPSCFESF